MSLTVLSWNVNGIRALGRQKEKNSLLFPMDADVVCIQETKVNERQHVVQVAGYQSYYSMPTRRKKIAYSGVATFIKPQYKVERVIKDDELLVGSLAGEGRIVIIVLPNCVIVNVYFVNDNEERRAFRIDFFNAIMDKLKALQAEEGKMVILCGDLNVVPCPREHCLYQSNYDSFYSDDPLRKAFKSLLEKEGFIDCFRLVNPEKEEAYTCWNTKLGTRASNFGTRIDYILILGVNNSGSCDKLILDAQIMPHVLGSDHCPVFAAFELNLEVQAVVSQKSTIMDFLTTTSNNNNSNNNDDDAVIGKKKKPRITRITTFFMPTENVKDESNSNTIDDSEISTMISRDSNDVDSTTDRVDSTKNTTGSSTHWKNIFKKQKVVLCKGHGEPCKLLQVQKKGPNYKRFFYICPRPLGKDSSNRCNHFEWFRQ